jgi:hypothetical protein
MRSKGVRWIYFPQTPFLRILRTIAGFTFGNAPRSGPAGGHSWKKPRVTHALRKERFQRMVAVARSEALSPRGFVFTRRNLGHADLRKSIEEPTSRRPIQGKLDRARSSSART